MKKPLLVIFLMFLCLSCNYNPNKEERIQELETKTQIVLDKVEVLENRVKTLEVTNEQLKAKLNELERQSED